MELYRGQWQIELVHRLICSWHNPPGRGQLAVFPCCSLDRYDSDIGASLAP
jgi:hypothetical protein